MSMVVEMIRVLAATLVLMTACADPPAPGGEVPPNAVPEGVPNVAEIVCGADGSTLVGTPQVLVQPDGIHLHVLSRLDEPASVNGFGIDVDGGSVEVVSARAPGRIDVACWPFSDHGSGEEPPTSPIEVLDPQGIYVSGEIRCEGMSWGSVSDFAELPLDTGPVPLEAARAAISGLRPDDEVLYVGYPEQTERTVAVRRDGAVVATFSFVTFDGEEWSVAGSEGCSSSGLESS